MVTGDYGPHPAEPGERTHSPVLHSAGLPCRCTLATHGRLVLVGLPADNEMKLPVFETVLGGISVIGSIVGTRRDLEEVFALHASGRTRVMYETRRLDQVNESFADVLNGRVDARLVFDLST
jgi:alcohol dehydrogenase, propanol-preferring